MQRINLLIVILLFFTVGFTAAQDQNRPIVISIIQEFDIPLTLDQNLFQISGGLSINSSRSMLFFQPLSTLIGVSYQLGRLQHDDLGNLGSLSMFSVKPNIKLHRLLFQRRIGVYLSGGVGYCYAFLNGELSSSVSYLVWNGRFGINRRVNPALTIGIRRFRRYEPVIAATKFYMILQQAPRFQQKIMFVNNNQYGG